MARAGASSTPQGPSVRLPLAPPAPRSTRWCAHATALEHASLRRPNPASRSPATPPRRRHAFPSVRAMPTAPLGSSATPGRVGSGVSDRSADREATARVATASTESVARPPAAALARRATSPAAPDPVNPCQPGAQSLISSAPSLHLAGSTERVTAPGLAVTPKPAPAAVPPPARDRPAWSAPATEPGPALKPRLPAPGTSSADRRHA
jgi:hypothetical protein